MSYDNERALWEGEWDKAFSRALRLGDRRLIYRLIVGPRLTVNELRSVAPLES